MLRLDLTDDELCVLSCLLAGEEILPSQAIALMTLDAKVTDIYQSKEDTDASTLP